ncbi:hypothetical protein BCR36DRAFT_9965 [Piromyces finnis]|uniref:DUF6985 domain-containing protein n=1 Tax=Piromyces finnis TaxID=1754191 RepID=A0A1Y1VF13_9FUNG|nr:hypothetical protein BCR36DRAFT_9965 [Piromyces finnis]|eukprot:ORX54696.1 hypothetical protein BCR36DRAFT_9965 [Piromyces finnis]
MTLIRDITKKNEYFLNGLIYCPFLEKDITVTIEEDADLVYAEKCANHLTNLDEKLINKICERISAYHQYMLSEWNDEFVKEINKKVPKDVSGRDILKYISQPELIIYEKPKEKKNDIGYTIAGLCSWEPEHGIDIILRNETLLYVGPSECLGSWADDDEYEVLY